MGLTELEIPAASGSDCPVLSCLVSGADAGMVLVKTTSDSVIPGGRTGRTLARQVTLNVAPLDRTDSPDEKRVRRSRSVNG